MIRKTTLALAAVAVLACAGTALADPVDDVTKKVHTATGGTTGGVGDVVGTGGGRSGRSAVVGYTVITANGDSTPTYSLLGALSDPALWTCSGAGTSATYTVTCLPASAAVDLHWHCDVLHTDASTTSDAGQARATLDCDGDGTPEAQTDVAHAFDSKNKWSVDTRLVTAFTCTVDLGVPNWTGGCGDPGLVGVE
jgi:hypothetical protein